MTRKKPRCSGMLCSNRPEEDRRDRDGPHTCPFDDDVYNGTGKECDCCEACAQACGWEA